MQNLRPSSATYQPSIAFASIGSAAWLIPVRSKQTERLDLGEGSFDDARTNLAEMWRLNAFFGGVTALTSHLFPRLCQSTQSMQIVDLGTGSGNLARHLTRWAKRQSLHIRLFPLDWSYRNLLIAQENVGSMPNAQLIQADSLRLPFAPNSIDYFVSTLFLHHFEPDQLVTLLGNAYALARRGIIMSDIVRGSLPLAAFHLIRPLFARHYLTYHDGILSIKRAYTPSELTAIAYKAGIENMRVYNHIPWRMTLVAEKARV